MSNTPPNFKNTDLYNAYYSLLNKVLTSYQSTFDEILRLKEARKTLTYNPSLKYRLEPPFPIPEQSAYYFDADKIEHNIREDIALNNIVDFTIDGLYEKIRELQEYKNCIQVMDSDPIIKTHIKPQLILFDSIHNLTHWRYISHFLKSMVFQYFDNKYIINEDAFNKYYNDLESFFYQDQLEILDITPLHHFKYLSLVNNIVVPTKVSIILSDVLRIVPVTREDKIRLWNRFPISRIDRSNDGINYVFEYVFRSHKESLEKDRIDTTYVFSTVVTLFHLIGVDCGIYDRATVTRSNLPIHLGNLDFNVSSVGVETSFHPYVVMPELDEFKHVWNKHGALLLQKVFDNKRYEGDHFANLKISIARFNDAFERKEGEDKFIDNIVALEALFSKKDDKSSWGKTERLSRRLAAFIEKDSHKREDIFCEMIELYKSRNEIIHGGYTEHYDIVKTRNYLIRSYLEYFKFLNDSNFSHIDFIKSLDVEGKQIAKSYDDCVQEIKAKNKGVV